MSDSESIFRRYIINPPYNWLRGYIFGIIYPAQQLFSEESEYYLDMRETFKVCVNAQRNHRYCDFVNFDFDGNMNKGPLENTNNSNVKCFEGVIGTRDVDNFYDPEKLFIIYVGGNAECYEQSFGLIEETADSKTNVIAFNPIGVGMSPGKCNGPEDYEASLDAIIKNLADNGIPYENIILKGFSLGGAISLAVAAKHQERGERVKVIADRTFARLDTEAASVVAKHIAKVLYYPVLGIINLFNLNIYSAKAFDRIYVINKEDVRAMSVENDEMISKEHSIYGNVNKDARKTGAVEQYISTDKKSTPHCTNKSYLFFSNIEVTGQSHTAQDFEDKFIAAQRNNKIRPTIKRH